MKSINAKLLIKDKQIKRLQERIKLLEEKLEKRKLKLKFNGFIEEEEE